MSDKRKEETKLQKAIKAALEAAGYLVRRINSGSVRVKRGYLHLAEKGTADLVVQGRGYCVWMEVKTPDGEVSEDQEAFKQNVAGLGGWYVVVVSPAQALNVMREIEAARGAAA